MQYNRPDSSAHAAVGTHEHKGPGVMSVADHLIMFITSSSHLKCGDGHSVLLRAFLQ